MQFTYCYDQEAKERNKRVQAKFVRAAAKLLPGFRVESNFLAGGIAVWGEHWVKISQDDKPVVEAIIEKEYTIVRQWDGQHSGHNHQLAYETRRDPERFAQLVRALAARPFVRF